MTDSETRTELFATLQSLGEVAGDMRCGQIMAAIGELCLDLHGRGLWDATDSELLEAAWQFRRDFEKAMASVPLRDNIDGSDSRQVGVLASTG